MGPSYGRDGASRCRSKVGAALLVSKGIDRAKERLGNCWAYNRQCRGGAWSAYDLLSESIVVLEEERVIPDDEVWRQGSSKSGLCEVQCRDGAKLVAISRVAQAKGLLGDAEILNSLVDQEFLGNLQIP